LSHLIGTERSLVKWQKSSILVFTGLLHSIYLYGDFDVHLRGGDYVEAVLEDNYFMLNVLSLSDLVTIVVAPREKHSTLPLCLSSLFSTIPVNVRVIICMPKLPKEIYQKSQQLIKARGCAQLYEFEADLIPHRARNLGANRATTPWIVFTDNDIIFEKNWLNSLMEPMQKQSADVIAPLIFIGPPTAKKIHHAGGLLKITKLPQGGVNVRETHRLMNKNINDSGIQETISSEDYRVCDVAEFHCLAIRAELLQGPLSLPENLITREQQDLALQCNKLGLKVQFVANSRVTYLAGTHFTSDDLRYHASRWSEQRAKCSLDFMESTWGMDFDRNRVLYKWIEKHRRRPFCERESAIAQGLLKRLPRRALGVYLRARYGYQV
jgi:GT2 family glycosyltransferase